MFAAQLYEQGVSAGYVMAFAMTLGTYHYPNHLLVARSVEEIGGDVVRVLRGAGDGVLGAT